ncbi:MAG: NlpC/P60 family protein [Candidatus Desulfacyla sp.]
MTASFSRSPLRPCIPLMMLLALSACAVKAPPPSPLPATEIPLMRYTIQAGAFSDVQNAVRLTRSLEEKGLSAYYFRAKDGLFKVRFGEFSVPSEALARAQSLLSEGIIDVYYIVSPESYAAAGATAADMGAIRSSLVETAESFIGIPYQWGGTSSDEGFDCSGLVMAVYQLNGFNLPRSSRDQFASGRPVGRNAMQKGDLVFFSFVKQNGVSHVGMYTGDGAFIHAPGRGKIIRKDSLSARSFATRFAGARTYLR